MSIDPILFPADAFETKTAELNGKTIVYKAYMHLQYVKNPVDADYQSLNVKVPVSFDGKPLDPSNKPILFKINVAGYTSTANKGDHKMAGPGGPGGPMGGPPPMGGSGGPPPGGAPGADVENLALAQGFTVVCPGCRGRDNQWPDGKFYGKAPAAMVDLKAAVRYIRHNAALIPGDKERIVSHGGSAGGAMSTLLAASGNSSLYAPYLEAVGAADERDDIYGSYSTSPVMNLENADGAYEWQNGLVPVSGRFGQPGSGPVDQSLSVRLKAIFTAYQQSLGLEGKNGFGLLTADNLAEYLMKEYLYPEAARYLLALGETERADYLEKNPWLHFDGKEASFDFGDFTIHAGREKSLPAFDDFEMTAAEPLEFGSDTEPARHFTDFSLQMTSGDPDARVSDELNVLKNMMNPMYFVGIDNPGCAPNWWIIHGAVDGATSLPIIFDLAACLERNGKSVHCRFIWDGGHCADDDPEGFISWMGKI